MWKSQRFSWWMTTMLHAFPESLAYDQKLQDTDLAYLFSSEKALGSLSESYVGLCFEYWGRLGAATGGDRLFVNSKFTENQGLHEGFPSKALFTWLDRARKHFVHSQGLCDPYGPVVCRTLAASQIRSIACVKIG